jgi:hypothetical protein
MSLAQSERSRLVKYTPSSLAPYLLCLGFQRGKWTGNAPNRRREWALSHRINSTKAIVVFETQGCRYKGYNKRSGSLNGRADLVFENAFGEDKKVEVEGSAYLKDHKIIQGILYHEPSDSIAIVSRNEIVEPEPWFIEAVKDVALQVKRFLEEFPERAARIWTPHPHVCPYCVNLECKKSRPSRAAERSDP